MENKEIIKAWTAPEFPTYERTRMWFAVAGAITLLCILYAIYSDSATMAIVFILLAGIYYMTHKQIPKMIEVKMTELGLQVDQTFYPYSAIRDFGIVFNPPYVSTLTIHLISGKTIKTVTIQLWNENPVEVRKIMKSQNISELEGMRESFTDSLIRILRLQ